MLLTRRYIPKALIKVGYACNNNCVFCHSTPLRAHRTLTTGEILERAATAGALGARMIVLSGGEPTILPELPDLAAELHRRGFALGVVTNGRMFSYKKFMDQLADAGLQYAFVSLHGDTPELHNRHTRAGTDSFTQTIHGLRNLRAAGVETTVNVVVTKWNLPRLSSIASILIATAAPVFIKFSLAEPKGAMLENFIELAPHPLEAARAIGEIAQIYSGMEQQGKVRILCDGFTPCLIEGFADMNDWLRTHYIYWMNETFEDRFYDVDFGARTKSKSCFDCSAYEDCPGIYKAYVDEMGAAYLTPRAFARSNGVVFSPAVAGEPAPCADGRVSLPQLADQPPDRFICVAADGPSDASHRLYRTDSADFTPETIAAIKSRPRGLVIAEDPEHAGGTIHGVMPSLAPAAACEGCLKHTVCPGLFEQCPPPGETAGENPAAGLIRSLRGRVLDVGPGRIFYSDILTDLLKSNLITYVAADPDPRAGEHPIFSLPGARFIHHAIGELDEPLHSFDCVLMIGSFNHIPHLNILAESLARLLTPGGRLIIEDNPALGLVASAPPRQAAPSGPPAPNDSPQNNNPPTFEHYHNFDLSNLLSWLESAGFVCSRSFPPDSSSATWTIEAIC